MKNLLRTAILIMLFANTAKTQMRIGPTNDAPNANAVLELDGTGKKGLLLPRMRKIDMLAIPMPAEALTVFLTDEHAIYTFANGSWVKVSGTGDSFELPYQKTFNIGTDAILWLNNGYPNGTGMAGQSNSGIGIYGISSSGKGVYGYSSQNTGIAVKGHGAVNAAGGQFSTSGGYSLLTEGGPVGLGTLTPSEGFVQVDATNHSSPNTLVINDESPVIQFQQSGTNKSVIRQLNNDLILRPNDNNFTGKVIIQGYNNGGWLFVDADGNTSLGANPATFSGTPNNTRMHIRSNNDEPLTLDSPIIAGGPTLRFIDKIGNNINNLGAINADDTKLSFKHKNAKYQWFGDGGSPIMELSHQSGLFTTPKYKIGGITSIGAGGLYEPDAPLHIADGLGFARTMIVQAAAPYISFRQFPDEKAFIQQLNNDLKIGTVISNSAGRFIMRTNGVDRMFVRADGKVIIGDGQGDAPTGTHLLAVKGKIAASEFDVVSLAGWADYVFDKNYKLKSLEETETFIKENKHLPNIPSATEIEKNGYGIAEMQKLMMEKIEELTLHLIEANKRIKELEGNITSQSLQVRGKNK